MLNEAVKKAILDSCNKVWAHNLRKFGTNVERNCVIFDTWDELKEDIEKIRRHNFEDTQENPIKPFEKAILNEEVFVPVFEEVSMDAAREEAKPLLEMLTTRRLEGSWVDNDLVLKALNAMYNERNHRPEVIDESSLDARHSFH